MKYLLIDVLVWWGVISNSLTSMAHAGSIYNKAYVVATPELIYSEFQKADNRGMNEQIFAEGEFNSEAISNETISNNQESDSAEESKIRVRYGVRAEGGLYVLANMYTDILEGQKYGGAGRAGGVLRFEWPFRFVIENSLMVGYAGAQVITEIRDRNDNTDIGIWNMELSVMPGYKVPLDEDISFVFNIGARSSVGLGGSVHWPEGVHDYPLYGKNGIFKRFDIWPTFGFSVESGNKSFSIWGNIGVGKLNKKDLFVQEKVMQGSLTFSFTYYFR